MNTRTYGIRNTAEHADSANSQHDQDSFVLELGTVTNETKQPILPVATDNPLTPGSLGS
jgi:hypothetical protein